MPLIQANTFLGYLKTFRVCWIRGRYGGGKTALAFRAAYELHRSGAVRYIISNCASPWCDNPKDVELVDGRADVCMILDEAGMFMESGIEAKQYMAYMRKLNVILILPSVLQPANLATFFSVERKYNLEVGAIPAWVYGMYLTYGHQKEQEQFIWWKPREIFGCYDTAGYPSEADEIKSWLVKWTKQSAKYAGYDLKRLPGGAAGGFRIVEDTPTPEVLPLDGGATGLDESAIYQPSAETALAGTGIGSEGNQLALAVDEVRRLSQSIEEATAQAQLTLSLLPDETSKKRRR